MWLATVILMVGLLALLASISREWKGPGRQDLGLMSQRWLSEHRAGRQ